MRPLQYSINITLDGCCDHREMTADDDLFQNAIENITRLRTTQPPVGSARTVTSDGAPSLAFDLSPTV